MNSIAGIALAIVILQSGYCSLSRAACLHAGKTEGAEEPGEYIIRVDKDGQNKNAEVRELLWCHWHEKQSGSLVVTWISLEGQTSKDTFVFEPDREGDWSLKVTIDREATKRTRRERVEYRAYAVERIRVPHGPQTDTVLIPEEEIVEGDGYRLILRNKENKTLAHI